MPPSTFRRCHKCPSRASNFQNESSLPAGPIIGSIPELQPIYQDEAASPDFKEYLDRVQSVEFQESVIIQYCAGARVLETCPRLKAGFAFEDVVIRSIDCMSSDPGIVGSPSFEIPVRPLNDRRTFSLSCPSTLVMTNVLVYDVALGRAFITANVDSIVILTNVSFVSTVATFSLHYRSQDSIIHLEHLSGATMTNVLFFNNTKQSTEHAFFSPIYGGAMTVQGNLLGANLAFVNTTLIQHGANCTIPYANASGTRIPGPERDFPIPSFPIPASVHGGALSVIGGAITIQYGWFIGNQAVRCMNKTLESISQTVHNLPSGGALHLADSAIADLTGVSFIGNRAAAGGAVSLGYGGDPTSGDSSLKGDSFNLLSCLFNWNTADWSGADIYALGEYMIAISVEQTSFLNSQTLPPSDYWQVPSTHNIPQYQEPLNQSIQSKKSKTLQQEGNSHGSRRKNRGKSHSSSSTPDYQSSERLYRSETSSHSSSEQYDGVSSTPPLAVFELPWGTSVALKTSVDFSSDAYLRMARCIFDRQNISASKNSPIHHRAHPITSPLLSIQHFTVVSIYESNFTYITSDATPLLLATHVASTSLLNLQVFHYLLVTGGNSPMIDVRYGGFSGEIQSRGTLEQKRDFFEPRFDPSLPPTEEQHASLKSVKQSHLQHRLDLLREIGFFEKYPSTDPHGSGSYYHINYDPESIESYASGRHTAAEKAVLEKAEENSLKAFLSVHQNHSGYESPDTAFRREDVPTPQGFCAVTPSEPISAGTNDHTPELLVYGLYVYECSSLNSVINAMSLKSVKILEAHWNLLPGEIPSAPTRKPYDFVLYISDIYGYVLVDRSDISNSLLPVMVLRSNVIEFGHLTLNHPLVGSAKFSKPAVIIRDSNSLFYHHSLLVGYRTFSRLSPVVVEQLRSSVYFKKVIMIANEGGQNGGALTIAFRASSSTSGLAAVIDECSFTSNKASSGGAIYSYGSLLIMNSVFVGNHATNGGAIFAALRTLCIYNSNFTDNYVSNQGGAILAQTLTTGIYASEFKRCSSEVIGGAIATSLGNLAIYKSFFRSCRSLDGGAIAATEYDITNSERIPPFSSSQFSNLPHQDQKQDSSRRYYVSTPVDVDLLDKVLRLPPTTLPKDPQEYLTRVATTLFEDNTALPGPRISSSSHFDFETFPWPTAFSSPKTNRGGAIFSNLNTRLSVIKCDFNSNFARTGGAIYALGNPPVFQIFEGNFSRNTAFYAGGAVALFAPTLFKTEIPDRYKPHPHALQTPKVPPYVVSSATFVNNTAGFGAALWLTPQEGQEMIISQTHWEGNTAQWGASLYFSGDESSLPIVSDSNITKNVANSVGPSLFFNGPPLRNASRIESFCSIDNACHQTHGSSRSMWGSNNDTVANSATTGYSLLFTLNYGENRTNATWTPLPYNLTSGYSQGGNSPATSQSGNCLLVDSSHPFHCPFNDTRLGDHDCPMPRELKTTPGDVTLSVTLMDALGQVVDDDNNYATCLSMVANEKRQVNVLWKPGTVSFYFNSVSFSLAVPSEEAILEESLYIPDTPRYEAKAVLVLGVENVSTGSSSVSAIEPNRFASTPLTLIPVHLSGCSPGYGLQPFSSNPDWAVCDVCPEGTYNFNGDGHCWLCADPSLPYSLVSCSYMFVRPMLGVFVAQGNENEFDIIICPFGFCSNCTAEAYTTHDQNTLGLNAHWLEHSLYWRRNKNSKKEGISAFFDFILGHDSSHDTYGASHFRRNTMGNYDWIIDEIEDEIEMKRSTSSSASQSNWNRSVSEDNPFHYRWPTTRRDFMDPSNSQCPNGDCVIGRDPASPLCGRCANGYHESLAFDVCSKNLCKKRQTGALVGVAIAFAVFGVLLHVIFYRYPAKTSISLFFIQVLPLMKVDILSPALENDTLRNVFCLSRVSSPLIRLLFFQLVPLYFAISILLLFAGQRIFVLTYKTLKRCFKVEGAKERPQRMQRVQRHSISALTHGVNVNTASADEDYRINGSSPELDERETEKTGKEKKREGLDSSSSFDSHDDYSHVYLDRDDASTGLLGKQSFEVHHISDWDQREVEPFFATSRLCRSLLALTTLAIIPSMRFVADLFHCVSVPGYKEKFWFSAPSMTCESSNFKILQGVTIPVVVLLFGGFVVLYGRTVAIYKKRIIDGLLVPPGSMDALWLRHCAYYYETFRATRYFWFGLHIAERIFLPLCVSFAWANPGALHFSASLSLLISCLFQAFTWSYLDPWDNLASCISLALLTLISLLRDSTFQGNVIDYASPRSSLAIFLLWLALNLTFAIIELIRFLVRFYQRRRRAL